MGGPGKTNGIRVHTKGFGCAALVLKEKKRTVYAGSRGLWEVLGRPVVSRPLKRGLDRRGGRGNFGVA